MSKKARGPAPKMFFYYKRMKKLGFEPVNRFQRRSNDVIGNYARFYPAQHSLLVFSEFEPAHRLVLYRLTPSEWDAYFEGSKTLSLDPRVDKPGSRSPTGGVFMAGNQAVIRQGGGAEPYLIRAHQLEKLVREVEVQYGLSPQPETVSV